MAMDRSSEKPVTQRETIRREGPQGSQTEVRTSALSAGLATNAAPRVQQQAMPIERLALDPQAKILPLAEDPNRNRSYVHAANALPVTGMAKAVTPEAMNQVARGGLAVQPLELRPAAAPAEASPDVKASSRVERDRNMERLLEQQRVAAINPTRATPEEAKDLGRQAVLNRVHAAIVQGGPEAGYETLRQMREALTQEAATARSNAGPKSLGRLVKLGVAPQGADRVLPISPEVRQAYIGGMEAALIRKPGNLNPAAEELVRDKSLSQVMEQARLDGLENVLGNKARPLSVEEGPAKAQTLASLKTSIEGLPPAVQNREIHLTLKAMEQARERHAEAIEFRASGSLRNPEALRLLGDRPLQVKGPELSPEIREAYRQQEIILAAPQVRAEFEAMKPYMEVRMAAVAKAEDGDIAGAVELQKLGHEMFFKAVESGQVSPETARGVRDAGMDPASTLENIRGVHPSVAERQWIQAQAVEVRQAIPTQAENIQMLAFRTPGRVFEEPIPVAAYQHQGQTHMAFETNGKVQHAALSEATADPRHPAHALAMGLEGALKEGSGPGGPSGFKLAQRGFALLSDKPGSTGPHEGAPLQVRESRTIERF